MEFLMRDDVNLSAEQWQSIDSAVIQAARNVLVGRKFLQIYGPLGAGAQSVNVDVLTPAEKGSVDFFGEEEEAGVGGPLFQQLEQGVLGALVHILGVFQNINFAV